MMMVYDEVLNGAKTLLQEALRLDLFFGLLIAFVAILAVIAITLFYIANKVKKIADKPEVFAEKTQAVMQAVSTPSPVQTDKSQLVAVIAAAIAESTGTDVSHIRIHSIRRV